MLSFIFVFAIIISLYGLINFYAAKRVFQIVKYVFPRANTKIFAVCFALIALTLILSFLPIPRFLDRFFSYIGSYWMGIFVYVTMLLLLSDLVILILKLTRVIPSPVSGQVRFISSLTALILTFGIVTYGVLHAYTIKHVSYDVKLNKETSTEMKIVLISDLHLGAVGNEKKLSKIVDGINKQSPDIVCIAGDFYNDDFYSIKNPEKVKNLLKSIDTKYGVYAILGNHDGGKTYLKMADFMEECGITLLNDEYTIIDNRLVLVGRVDASPIGGFGEIKRKPYSEVFAKIDSTLPVVVMDHTPSHTEEYGSDVDLVLSGHTHKGQLYPFNYVTNAIFVVDYGHYQKDPQSTNFIVTSGIGTWGMPMRVGSNCEIVTINIS